MWKFRKTGGSVTLAVFAAIAIVGCQNTGSRFAFFGKPNEVAQQKAAGQTVSHVVPAEERQEEAFYTSEEASRLGGTSIAHISPGRTKPKKKTARQAGPGSPTAGSGSRSY